jgi:nucleosome binding factor SPN SPT16 subunit
VSCALGSTILTTSSVDLPISEGPVNLSWPAIMKTINDDPYEFFNEGGWGFLTGVDEHGDEDASESSEESEFDASDVAGSSDDDDSDASCKWHFW